MRARNDRRQVEMHSLTHLDRLESESIHILREAVAGSERPVMLYSIGKDSSVMLHLALRRSIPASRPFRCCTSTRPGSSATWSRFATAGLRNSGSS
jgi:3'-phosphoadenosine 5'-phosphosulfate sulfotransferase (PAPS reductase)/FAD synthetase